MAHGRRGAGGEDAVTCRDAGCVGRWFSQYWRWTCADVAGFHMVTARDGFGVGVSMVLRHGGGLCSGGSVSRGCTLRQDSAAHRGVGQGISWCSATPLRPPVMRSRWVALTKRRCVVMAMPLLDGARV